MKLNDLRNRVAHHEPLSPVAAKNYHIQLLELTGWISPDLRDYIASASTCAAHIDAVVGAG